MRNTSHVLADELLRDGPDVLDASRIPRLEGDSGIAAIESKELAKNDA